MFMLQTSFLSLLLVIYFGFLSVWTFAQQENPGVSRYEMVRMLLDAACMDCITPSAAWQGTYTSDRWNVFQSDLMHNFTDIIYNDAQHNGVNYYYCVAHAGAQGWVNGYPLNAFGFCKGEFCGVNNALASELLQMTLNISASRIRNSYLIDFTTIRDRLVQNNWPVEELALANRSITRCDGETCIPRDLDEFKLYLRYCTFHLEQCGMQPIWWLMQGFWPVAELNVLTQHWIIRPDDALLTRLKAVISESDIQRVLWWLEALYICPDAGIVDSDGDGVADYLDNCPTDRNPSQRDMDDDGIGDVCDEDIDGDWLLNIKGYLDDRWWIRMNMMSTDPCPLIPREQWISDNCAENIQYRASALDINAQPTIIPVGWDTILTPDTAWPITDIERDFGNGVFWYGTGPQMISYLTPWIYNVVATSRDISNQLLRATAQVVVYDTIIDAGTTVLGCTPLISNVGEEISCIHAFQNLDLSKLTLLERNRWDNTIQYYTPDQIEDIMREQYRYRIPGLYYVTVTAYFGTEASIVQQLTLRVLGNSVCLDPNACDLDGDSTPDTCDDDIDGDSIKNPLGLVLRDHDDCRFDQENIDTSLLQLQRTQPNMERDNCPFVSNTDQQDSDSDNVGDLCTWTLDLNDRDGDGIPDDQDACPEAPENYNGIQDADGCPELPSSCAPGNNCSGKAPACNTCPCPGADFASELWKGDRIRALLLDENAEIIYRYSPLEVINATIPDKILGK